LIGLLIFPILNSAWATGDLSTLSTPDVAISPTSGPPGTTITITVSNIPDISKEAYPYPDLYIWLPFSQPFGATPQSQCGGQDCFLIYTHDNALNHDFADRTITFSLFSKTNPSPVYLNGFENSICDVTVNGKIVGRYSTLCNTKDEPTGTYQIKLGWAEENAPQINYVGKIVQFTVTPGSQPPQPQQADNGNSIIQAYQNGQVSESQFYSKLKDLGWNDEQIRQALATIGKLPHQMGAPVPDEMLQIQQGVEKAAQQANAQSFQQQPAQSVITEQTTTLGTTEQSSQQQAQTGSNQAKQNNLWAMVTIAASLAAAGAIGGSLVVVRHTRKVTN